MPDNQILDLGLAMVAGVVGAYVTVRVQMARFEERLKAMAADIVIQVDHGKDRSNRHEKRLDRLEAK